LLGWVRVPVVPHRHRSYSALRLPVSFGLGFGSPCLRPTSRRALFLAGSPVRSQTRVRRRFVFFPAPRGPFLLEENAGSPGFPGCPLRACRGRTPRRSPCPLARCAVAELLPSGKSTPWALPELSFRWLHSRGPHARPPTHQQRRYRSCCKAGYQPAGLSFDWAGFAPAGQLIRI